MKFTILKRSEKHFGRTGVLETPHGKILSPFFMPIATKGAVKNLESAELTYLGAQIVLSNTYHQLLKPGVTVLKKAGGLHKFMNWDGPMLTDSGGFQVFSLSKMRKLSTKGVEFSSHIDGKKYMLTPEESIKIQKCIGADIIMVLDECPAGGATQEYVRSSLELTTQWAKRSKMYHEKHKSLYGYQQALFGIVQGGRFKKLRKLSAQQLVALDFDGYAIGGVSVGESRKTVQEIVSFTTPLLPEDKPRYLMGVGRPEEIVSAVQAGVDMFDCVIPTREARHGRLYYFVSPRTKSSVKLFHNLAYKTLHIRNSRYVRDFSAINADSKVDSLQCYSKAYLRHLLNIEEGLGYRLATLHNLEFYLRLMQELRESM